MKIAIESFLGTAPKIAPRYLPDGAAQVAIDVAAFGQSLRPLRGNGGLIKALGTGVEAIYKFGQNVVADDQFWFNWTLPVDVCRSQIAGDGTAEWTFYTGAPDPGGSIAGYPKATYNGIAHTPGSPLPTAYLRLGLPAPLTALKGTVGEPEYCEIDGVRDTSLDTQAACTASGFCEVDGVRNDTYKTKATCEAQTKGVWTPGVWITGSKLSPATITLSPSILSQVTSSYGLKLSTDAGAHYVTAQPSGTAAPAVTVTQVNLEDMTEDYGIKVSLDGGYTWASGALNHDISQYANLTLDSGEINSIRYQTTLKVTVTVNGAPTVVSIPAAPLSSASAVASALNSMAGSIVVASLALSGTGVAVRTVAKGANVALRIEWAANAFRTSDGSSLLEAQQQLQSVLTGLQLNNTQVVSAVISGTTVIVTAKSSGPSIKLVVRWGSNSNQQLAKDGTAFDVTILVGLINAIPVSATYKGATAEKVDDSLVITSTLTGKDATLRVMWGEGSTQVLNATGVTGDLGTKETRVYTYTWVLKQGDMEWESAPWTIKTMPTHDVYPGGSVTLTGFETPTALKATARTDGGGWGPTSAGKLYYRIYRAVNGVYLYVDETPEVWPTATFTGTYIDLKDADELGEELPSLLWTAPPRDLAGIINLPNGMMAGFTLLDDGTPGRELRFCEPYRPFAWPDTYSQVVDYPVVGLGRMDTTLAVLTKGVPYFIQGSAPDVVVMVKSDIEQACVSKRSIVSIGGMVLYASPDGLMLLSSSGSDVLTKDFMDREQWQALTPSSIHAYGHDNQYVAFHAAATDRFGNVTTGFVLDLKSKQFVRHTLQALCGFNDLRNDQLFLVDATGALVKWGVGDYLAGKWRSKLFSQPQMTGFACAQVEAAGLYEADWKTPDPTRPAYPVTTMQLYVDGRPFYNKTVSTGQYYGSTPAELLAERNPFRLPPLSNSAGDFLGRDWEIELNVNQEIFNVALAQSMSEIAGT